MRHLSVIFCLCSLVHASYKIKSVERQDVTVGASVTLQCQLVAVHQNVFQITWQKESGNFTGPVATYSKKYGPKLIDGYLSQRTELYTVDALDVSTITIYPVSMEDQGCFTCIFNIYPIGANSGRTCLDVFETNLLEPRLEINQTNSSNTSDKLYIVTCSAIGYPAPNITWTLPEGLEITPETYITVHTNRTVVVVSNFTQRVTRTALKVTCVVHHPTLYSEKRLSGFIETSGEEDSSSSSPSSQSVPFVAIIIIGVFGMVIAGIVIYLTNHMKTRKKNPIEQQCLSTTNCLI